MNENTTELLPMPKNCNICGGEYDETCGGTQGHFGVTPVTFCEWCYSSIIDTVITQYNKKQRFFNVTFDEPCGMSRK